MLLTELPPAVNIVSATSYLIVPVSGYSTALPSFYV